MFLVFLRHGSKIKSTLPVLCDFSGKYNVIAFRTKYLHEPRLVELACSVDKSIGCLLRSVKALGAFNTSSTRCLNLRCFGLLRSKKYG